MAQNCHNLGWNSTKTVSRVISSCVSTTFSHLWIIWSEIIVSGLISISCKLHVDSVISSFGLFSHGALLIGTPPFLVPFWPRLQTKSKRCEITPQQLEVWIDYFKGTVFASFSINLLKRRYRKIILWTQNLHGCIKL